MAPDLIIDGCELPCECWEWNPGPLEEQPVFLISSAPLGEFFGSFSSVVYEQLFTTTLPNELGWQQRIWLLSQQILVPRSFVQVNLEP